jgi:hypothetical protein
MTAQSLELAGLYRLALERAEAEGILSSESKAALELVLEAVASELQAYRSHKRQVVGAWQEQTRQELQRASRFTSRSTARQIRSKLDQPAAATADGKALLFYGLAPAEAADSAIAKEPSRIGRSGSEQRPWLKAGLGPRAPVGRAPQVAGPFLFAAMEGVKPASILGEAPVAETAKAEGSDE